MNKFPILFFGFIGLLGLGIVFWSANDYLAAWDARSWPTVTGEIVKSKVKKSKKGGVFGSSYLAYIKYAYEFDGMSYTGKRVLFGPKIISRTQAEELVRQFRAGENVEIYVNPENPSSAALDPYSISGYLKWKLIGGLFFICGGIFLVLVVWLEKPDK